MTHADDNGLLLPPSLAPHQIVILPIVKDESQRDKIVSACDNLQSLLCHKKYAGESLRVHIDSREMRDGEKAWSWVKKGVPIRLELGSREIDQGCVSVSQRHQNYDFGFVFRSHFMAGLTPGFSGGEALRGIAWNTF